MAQTLPNLEIHVTHACNLACEGCSHFSDQNHKGNVSLREAEEWMKLWRDRLSPSTFSIMGGEPTLHPDFLEFINLSRRYWPASTIRIVSNALLLDKHPDLPKVMDEIGNTYLHISIHHGSINFLRRISDNIGMVRQWIRDYDTDVHFMKSYEGWSRRYHGYGAEMEPFNDENPSQSWKICQSKRCQQLFDGKIWKCPPLAYLDMQDKKYGLSESWQPYLQYQPLNPDCSEEELMSFFDRKEESVCGMCPAEKMPFNKPVPFPNRVEAEPEEIGDLDPFLLYVVTHQGNMNKQKVQAAAKSNISAAVTMIDESQYQVELSFK